MARRPLRNVDNDDDKADVQEREGLSKASRETNRKEDLDSSGPGWLAQRGKNWKRQGLVTQVGANKIKLRIAFRSRGGSRFET